jgi:hypothetical protein
MVEGVFSRRFVLVVLPPEMSDIGGGGSRILQMPQIERLARRTLSAWRARDGERSSIHPE